jgi:hypothetical protein
VRIVVTGPDPAPVARALEELRGELPEAERQAILAIARAHPDRRVWIKLRHLPGENAGHLHKEEFDYPSLLPDLPGGAPANLDVTAISMAESLQRAGVGITCTSTAGSAFTAAREAEKVGPLPSGRLLPVPSDSFAPFVPLALLGSSSCGMRMHAPVAPSKAQPWYGHSMHRPSSAMRPSDSGASRWEQRSIVQRHAPPALSHHSTSGAPIKVTAEGAVRLVCAAKANGHHCSAQI